MAQVVLEHVWKVYEGKVEAVKMRISWLKTKNFSYYLAHLAVEKQRHFV